jgi:hypothetical protein
MIDGEITNSDSLSRVSIEAAHTFVLLWTVMDDHGRCDGRHKLLLSQLYPLRDDVTLEALGRWLAELEAEGCIAPYQAEGRAYYHAPNWARFQRLRDSQSKHPGPPEPDADCATTPEDAEPRGSSPQPAAGRGTLRPEARSEKREARSENTKTPPAAAGARVSKPTNGHAPATGPPERLSDDQRLRVSAWASGCDPPVSRDDCLRAEAVVLDWARSKGVRKRDWVATVRNGIRRGWALEKQQARASPSRESFADRVTRIAQGDF